MTRPLKKPLYDNYVLQAPDGEQLCRCNREKAEWYLSRNLGELVESNPTAVRLKFEPKGRGHSGDPFYMSQKANCCVVCGVGEGLTKHHVVPHCFRRFFPDSVKRFNAHDIVAVCISCHDKYETFAHQLKVSLSDYYGVPFTGRGVVLDRKLYTVRRHASALKHYRDRIPLHRIELLIQTLRNFFKKDQITPEDIERASKIRPLVKTTDCMKFGECIVKRVQENLDLFVIMWRKHFLSTMKPKFMPAHWSVDRTILS